MMKGTRHTIPDLTRHLRRWLEPVHSVHQQVADRAFGALDEAEYAKGYATPREIGQHDAEAEKGD